MEKIIYGVIFQISRHSSGLLLAGLIQIEIIKGYEFERHMLYHRCFLMLWAPGRMEISGKFC